LLEQQVIREERKMNLHQAIMIIIQVSIFLTVFGYGLQATGEDALYLVRRPLVLVRSFIAMFVIMPIVAVVLTTVFHFHLAVEITLLALAISPIPPLLPRRQVMSGGRASYALGLMATVALLSIGFIPLVLYMMGWFFNETITTAPGAVTRLVLLTILVPLAVGMAFRAIATKLAVRIVKPVKLISIVLLGLGSLAIIVAALPTMISLIGDGTILVIVGFVAIGLMVGHLFGGRDHDDQVVLAISTACRHPAIALAIAAAAFPDQKKLVIGALLLYLLLNVIVSIPYVMWQRRPTA
jgi:bile acid:Na+ symporter, BASS family